ncbi:MAG: hypothetical protein L0G70_05075 [Rubrobacter sp.]|nr:hypothetical protein [Rubrobacter sp.]
MYGKIASGSTAGGAGAVAVLPDTGGFLSPAMGLQAVVVFVAAFTLIAAGLALWNIVPRRER